MSRDNTGSLLVRIVFAGMLALPVFAADFQGWHILEGIFRPNDSAEVLLHSRWQTRDQYGQLQQVRAGLTFRWTKLRRVIPYGGFYQPVHESNADRVHAGARSFGGVEMPFRLRASMLVTTRVAWERLYTHVRPDFNRYRSFGRIMLDRTVTPFLQNEVFLVRQGFHSTRTGAGVRWRMTPYSTLDLGYFYDVRSSQWNGSRSWILTSLRFHPPRHER